MLRESHRQFDQLPTLIQGVDTGECMSLKLRSVVYLLGRGWVQTHKCLGSFPHLTHMCHTCVLDAVARGSDFAKSIELASCELLDRRASISRNFPISRSTVQSSDSRPDSA